MTISSLGCFHRLRNILICVIALCGVLYRKALLQSRKSFSPWHIPHQVSCVLRRNVLKGLIQYPTNLSHLSKTTGRDYFSDHCGMWNPTDVDSQFHNNIHCMSITRSLLMSDVARCRTVFPPSQRYIISGVPQVIWHCSFPTALIFKLNCFTYETADFEFDTRLIISICAPSPHHFTPPGVLACARYSTKTDKSLTLEKDIQS